MSLRTRLVLAFVATLVAAIASIGFIAVRTNRTTLLDQVDQTLDSAALRFTTRPDIAPAVQPRPNADARTARAIAFLTFTPTGDLVNSIPSGFADDPDPLPAIVNLDDLLGQTDGRSTVASADGTVDYRVLAVQADGLVAVSAVPMNYINDATDRLVQRLILTGVLVAAAGMILTLWSAKNGLRPVDTMVDTATAIAAGDLAQRVPEHQPHTELGQLGTALNNMLVQIDTAFKHEQRSQQQLNQFIADASHELRTPLATIQGYADMHRQGALSDTDRLDDAMGRIRTQTARMQRLVDDLLLLARLDRGQPLANDRLDITAVIKDAITDNLVIEPDRPITYRGPDSAAVFGDEQRLAQVITNLLANVRSHTPPGTSVEIVVTTANGPTVIDVIDNGPGLDAAELDSIFDRFHHRPTTQQQPHANTGLGLAIVKAIVETHDGTITAANNADGGARFTIALSPTAGQ